MAGIGDISRKDGVQVNAKPAVFISYCQDDKEWKKLLYPYLKALALANHLVLWDDRKIDVGADWYPEIQKALACADAAICLITQNFLASDFIIKEEIPHLLKKRQDEGMLLVPILISPCPWQSIPWLKSIQMYTYEKRSIAESRDAIEQAKAFTEIANFICDNISRLGRTSAPGGSAVAVLESLGTTSVPSVLPQILVDIDRLPVTGSELFGRQKELKLLDDAWDKGKLNAISFVAYGGVGKSTLINKWLESMRADNFRGVERVFGWSFYSQGAGEKATSADLFIAEALQWFGDPDPKEGSPWDKGQRLAELVRKEKTIVILDGLEPLQSAYDFEKGKIKDPALSVLVDDLCRENAGLLIITTREDVAELEGADERVVQQNLEQITPEAGRALLRAAGVRGTDKELEDASSAFGNQALALRLLGSYLYGEEGHRITHISKIPGLEHMPPENGRHPRRAMAAFEARFGEGPEKELLRILGLFDRPAEQTAVDALLEGDPIPNLTGHLKKMDTAEQKSLLARLRRLKLIAEEGSHDGGKVDAHPLVREHFGDQLKTNYPDAWREGNGRLYEYFKAQAPELPDTLEEMSPLFTAVAHGCAARRHQEALDEVYLRRISRGNEAFSCKKLGAFGSGLACISHFFEEQWHEPVAGLTDGNKAFVLNEAGFGLRALGRLKEAIEPMQTGMEMRMVQKSWANASIAASNLSELLLVMGEVCKAVEYAEESVKFADQSGDAFQKMARRTDHADVLFQAGRIEEAEKLLIEAEEMQKERHIGYPWLYSIGGFRYCQLLLEEKDYGDVLKRAEKTLELVSKQNWLLDIALDNLSLGRAHMLKAVKEGVKDYSEAEEYLNGAVEWFRKAGQRQELPRGLLARSELFRIKGTFDRSKHDLDEAMTISTRCGMKLYEADCHLEYARLYSAQGDEEKAKEHLSIAKNMIDEMGYHRRDKEVK